MTETMEAKYRKFIAAIDNSVAKRGLYGLLSEYIEGSAEQNADDTLGSRALTAYGTRSDEFWAEALSNAEMILGDWRSFYPELRKD